MKNAIGKAIKKILWRLGYEIIPAQKSDISFDVGTVIDVGVANGTPELLEKYPSSYFFMIEPNTSYHTHIEENLLSTVKGKLIPFAAGSVAEEKDLFLDGVSSGFYRRDTDSRALRTAATSVSLLDELILGDSDFDRSSKFLLKIDTEGFELEVLRGATKLLCHPNLAALQVEVRFSFISESYNPSDLFVFLNKYGLKFHSCNEVAVRRSGLSYIDLNFQKI